MKPSAIRIVSVTELAPRPVRSVGNGVTGVLAPSTALRFEYVTAPRKLEPIVWKISANDTIQTTTEPITAPRIPIVCPRVTCLISPPIEIEKAAPIRGRKAQFASSSVLDQS